VIFKVTSILQLIRRVNTMTYLKKSDRKDIITKILTLNELIVMLAKRYALTIKVLAMGEDVEDDGEEIKDMSTEICSMIGANVTSMLEISSTELKDMINKEKEKFAQYQEEMENVPLEEIKNINKINNLYQT